MHRTVVSVDAPRFGSSASVVAHPCLPEPINLRLCAPNNQLMTKTPWSPEEALPRYAPRSRTVVVDCNTNDRPLGAPLRRMMLVNVIQ